MFRTAGIATGVIGILAFSSLQAADWPHWRGPGFNGTSDAQGLPATFSKTENLLWSVPLPGPAAATPIVVGNRVFISSTSPKDEKLLAMALDRASGKVLWQEQVGSGYQRDSRSTLASPSPVSDGERVYFYYGTGDLAAFTLDGKKIWARNLQEDMGIFNFLWTYSTSPTVFEGRLYIQVLQRDTPVDRSKPVDPVATDKPADSYLLALDPATGKELWRVARPTEARIESRESFTTPIPFRHEGKNFLAVSGADILTGHDPATGKELWRWGTWNPQHIHHWRQVPSPVYGAGVILACAPKKEPVYAIRAGGEGDISASGKVWDSGAQSPVSSDVPTPLFYQDHFFVLSDVRKVLSRVNPADGSVVWSLPLPGKYLWRSSPAGADGRIWCMNHHGDVMVADAASGKQLLLAAMGEEDDDNIQSSLVPVGSQLFIRTNGFLHCIGK